MSSPNPALISQPRKDLSKIHLNTNIPSSAPKLADRGNRLKVGDMVIAKNHLVGSKRIAPFR